MMKSGYCFGMFGCYLIVFIVERFGGVYVFFYNIKIFKVCYKNLKV